MKTKKPVSPDREEVRGQLRRICCSKSFKSSPRLTGLLEFLVEEVLSGNGESLGEYRVGTEALGLSQDFDPGAKSLVRSHAGRLRKALAAYYSSEGRDDRMLISMPDVGYRVAFSRLGAAQRRRASPAKLPTLLIADFRGIGLRESQSDLPATVTEDLARCLCRAVHLRIARGGGNGNTVQPDFLLEGSLELRGARMLIRSRLLEANTGLQIWGRRHEFPAAKWNPAAFEQEIVEAIAVEIGSDFGRIDRHLLGKNSSSKPKAPSLETALLKVKAFVTDFTEKSNNEAMLDLGNFLKSSPANPEANALIAVLMLTAYLEYFRRDEPFPEAALEHLDIAQAGDPTNPYLHHGRLLAMLARRRHGELAKAVDALLKVPDYPPGLMAFAFLCRLYTRTATPRIRKLLKGYMKQNPEYPRVFHTGFALECLAGGEFEAARREMALARLPSYWFDLVVTLAIEHAAGRRAESRSEKNKLLRLCPDFPLIGRELLGRSLHSDFVDLLMKPFAACV
jgi:adenylate cyclase